MVDKKITPNKDAFISSFFFCKAVVIKPKEGIKRIIRQILNTLNIFKVPLKLKPKKAPQNGIIDKKSIML